MLFKNADSKGTHQQVLSIHLNCLFQNAPHEENLKKDCILTICGDH